MAQKHSQSQSSFQIQNQRQRGMQAQRFRQEMKSGYDDLGELDEYDDEMPQIGFDVDEWNNDTGDDESDSDSRTDADPEPPPKLVALAGKRARILFRLVVSEKGELAAIPCVKPRGEAAEEALEELQADVVEILRRAQSKFTDEEWGETLGLVQADPVKRLTLIIKASVPASELFENKNGVGQHCPSDRTLPQYGKFAALPDGVPFSLRLLFQDNRGKNTNSKWFKSLPYVLKLIAFEHVRRQEAERGVIFTDIELAAMMERALADLGLVDPARSYITDGNIRGFRDKLKKKGLGYLFPNARQRRRQLRPNGTTGEQCEGSTS